MAPDAALADRDGPHPRSWGVSVELLFLPLVPFVLFPPLAWLVAAGLAWSARRGHGLGGRRLVRAVAALWLLYGVYESAHWAWSLRVSAPIRVDLLVIAPLLVGASAGAIACLWRADRKR